MPRVSLTSLLLYHLDNIRSTAVHLGPNPGKKDEHGSHLYCRSNFAANRATHQTPNQIHFFKALPEFARAYLSLLNRIKSD